MEQRQGTVMASAVSQPLLLDTHGPATDPMEPEWQIDCSAVLELVPCAVALFVDTVDEH